MEENNFGFCLALLHSHMACVSRIFELGTAQDEEENCPSDRDVRPEMDIARVKRDGSSPRPDLDLSVETEVNSRRRAKWRFGGGGPAAASGGYHYGWETKCSEGEGNKNRGEQATRVSV